ncbi:26S proteasome non-ATPase regulatory subunit 4 homolog [Linum perenne]
MICIDNSESMRNEDYSPSRFEAQADAVSLICGAKTQLNPENTVGIMTMAGKGVRVLTAPTTDLGKLLLCMHGLEIGGEVNISSAVQIAQLALKHRQNKNQRQRIVLFVGSPINYDKKKLEAIGKKLKKSSVCLDIVDFGEEDYGKPEKLEAFVAAANNNGSSHIVHIPPGPDVLSDVLISTPVINGDEEDVRNPGAGGGDYDFGVDPELALALRLSMEEERVRQEATAAVEEESNRENYAVGTMSENEELLEEAFSLARQGSDELDSMMRESGLFDEEEMDAAALEMSLRSWPSAEKRDENKVREDRAYMENVITTLPGIDRNNPLFTNLFATLDRKREAEKEKDDQKKDDEDDKPPKE